MMSRDVKKLFTGSVLNNITFIVKIGITLVLMPFIIRHIGDRYYGLWVIVGSLTGYFGFMDLGLSSATWRYISQGIGKKDNQKVNFVLNTSLVLFFCIGLVALLATVVLSLLGPLFFDSVMEVKLFSQVVVFIGLSFAIGFPFRALNGFLIAMMRYDLINILELGKVLIRAALIFASLSLGHGIMALAVITFFVECVGFFVSLTFVWVIYRNYVELSPFKYFQKKQMTELFHFSKFAFVAQTADILRFKIDALVITAFIGLPMVTHYHVAKRLIDYFQRIVVQTVNVIKPYYSRLEGEQNIQQLEKYYLFSLKVSFFLSFLIGAGLLVMGRPFIQLWMGIDYLDAMFPLYILAFAFTLALAQAPSIQLLYATSNHKYLSYANLLEGIANLSLSILLIQKYSILGVALGTAIPMIISRTFVLPLMVNALVVKRNRMSISLFKYLLGLFVRCAASVSIAYAVFIQFIREPHMSLVSVVFNMILLGIPYVAATAFILFNASERSLLRKIVRIGGIST